jgi:hypothetical protein
MSAVPLVFHPADGYWVEVSATHPTPEKGWKYYANTNSFEPPNPEEVELERVKSVARKTIAGAAIDARRSIMPDEYGQMEVYREKYEQAIDFLSSQDTVQYSEYPLLEIESRILDIPMKKVAENVIKRRSEWISKLTKIEELRLFGKVNIKACNDIREVELLVSHLSNKLLDLVG